MDMNPDKPVLLPSADQLRQAMSLYLSGAYSGDPPAAAVRMLPPDPFDPREWLMSDAVERDPADAPLQGIRSFKLRLGNSHYPHMKLCLSRPPKDPVFLFSVDCHDAFLHAPSESPDHAALEDLKRRNGAMAGAITAAWDAAGLPTDRNYLRQAIRQTRAAGQPPAGETSLS
jgi:hypothetical protein